MRQTTVKWVVVAVARETETNERNAEIAGTLVSSSDTHFESRTLLIDLYPMLTERRRIPIASDGGGWFTALGPSK